MTDMEVSANANSATTPVSGAVVGMVHVATAKAPSAPAATDSEQSVATGGADTSDLLVHTPAVEGKVQGPGSLPQVLCDAALPSPSRTDAEASADDDGPLPLGSADRAMVTSSSIISSHEASFCNSLMVSHANNLNLQADSVGRAAYAVAYSTAAMAPVAAPAVDGDCTAARLSSSEPRPSLPQQALTLTSPPPPPLRPRTTATARVAESATATATAAHQRTTSPDGTSTTLTSPNSPPHPHSRRLTSSAGDVKTLKDLLEWRAHLSTSLHSLDTHDSRDAASEDGKGRTDGQERHHTDSGHPDATTWANGRPLAALRPVPEESTDSHASPHTSTGRGGHVGVCESSALGTPFSSPTGAAATPVSGSGGGGSTTALPPLRGTRHSHPSSGAASHTDGADAFYTARVASHTSSSQPGSPVPLPEGDLHHALLHAHHGPYVSPYGSPVAHAAPPPPPRGTRITFTDARVPSGGVGGRSHRSGGGPSSVVSSAVSPHQEGLARPDRASPRSSGLHTPLLHPGHPSGLERAACLHGTPLPPPLGRASASASATSHSTPTTDSGDRHDSRESHPRLHHSGNGALERRHSHASPQSWHHRVASLPNRALRPWREVSSPQELSAFAMPADEETNKAVVAFVSGLILAICLGVICFM